METNNTSSNGIYSSSNSSTKPSTNGDLHTDDFLIEFFPELKVPEVHSLSKNLKEMQQEDLMMNGHRSLVDDLSIQIEKLKQMNKELKEKSILQESQIAKYEADLSEKMQDVLTANQELEAVKDKHHVLITENDKLVKEMTQVKAQVMQLLDSRDESNQANNQIIELQKDISSKEKVQRKMKNELELASVKLAEKNGHVRKMKSANKKLWNMIMEMGETLSKNGLLTAKRKEQCLKEIDDQVSNSELGFEGENVKAFLCGLSSTTGPAAGPSNATQSGNKRILSNSSEPANFPGSSIERQQSRYSAIITPSSENASNIKSYGTNYLMKKHKVVIDELVSEDYDELNSLRQQLSVRNDPISPLPPTPPPKNSKLKTDNNQLAKSSVSAGKKLNFFHQQSESFEVQNVEPVKKLPLSSSVCATPTPPKPSQYTISSKLNYDGSLKLDFSANYDTHLSFDMNTRKVSCTVMPSAQIQTDCSSLTDSPPKASPHPISSEYAMSQTSQELSNHSSRSLVKSNCPESVTDKYTSTYAGATKRIGSMTSSPANSLNEESLRSPKKLKLDNDNFSKKIQKPVSSTCTSSPKQNERGNLKLLQNNLNSPPEGRVPFITNTSVSHEKKTLNDIGRSGAIYSAFVSPTEKRVTIPSVRVSPRQLKANSSSFESQMRPMEIDNQLQGDKISTNDDKSPKKRKKYPRRIKDASQDLLKSSKKKGKKKNNKITKKRKTLSLEGEINDVVLDEKSKCSDSNNEDESKRLQHSGAPTCNSSLKTDSQSPIKSEIMLQNDSLSMNTQKELNTPPPDRGISDLFKVPCVLNEDAKKIKGSASKVAVEDSPKGADLCEDTTVQSEDKLNNDMDFSDIQVSPFNPSTFVPRGLFVSKLSNNDGTENSDIYKASKDSVFNQENASLANDEFASSCLQSQLKEPLNTHLNNAVSIVSDGVAENSLIATHSDAAFNTLSNGHLVPNDGIDSDHSHSLVIAESGEDMEQNVAASDSAGNSTSPSKSEAVRKKSPRKQPKNKLTAKKPQTKKCSRKMEGPEAVDVTIAGAFKSLEEMKFTDMHFKQNQHTLVNALINPKNAAEPKDVVYQVLKYLISSRANPLLHYYMSEEESVLMPLTEKCIVQSLFQISKKKKSRLHGLMLLVVNTAYELILGKELLQIYGLSSLCRVLTEICRWLEDKKCPLKLCSELLKLQHKFAPYLIASIAGVWKELFSVENISDEEMIFHSSIVYGTRKKPATLNEQQWKHCSKVLSLYLSAQFPFQINEMVTFLVQTIETKCVTESLEDDYILFTPLVVFTAVEGWTWAKEFLIDVHIIPLLVKFSEQELNEKAFNVFCQLYADVCYFCPNEEDPHEVFGEFFTNDSVEENDFVRDAAAMAQIKLLLHKKQLLPEHLTEWISQVQHKPDFVEYAERLFQRRLMNDTGELLKSEVHL